MLLLWFLYEKKAGFVGRAMGCIFGCFGIRDSRSNHVSSPPFEQEPARGKSALSSLLPSDDESPPKEGEGQRPVPRKLDTKEHNDERNMEIWKEIRAQNWEEKSLKLSSWFANASSETLEKQSKGHPTSVKIREESVTGSDSFAESPSSCMTERHDTGSFSSSRGKKYGMLNAVTPIAMCDSETCSDTSSVSPLPFAHHANSTIQSVLFIHKSDGSAFSSEGSSECAIQHIKQYGLAGNRIVTKPSPYPTPLKLTKEMQTLGSEFPIHIDRTASGIFCKYMAHDACSVPNLIENSSQWNILNEECSSYHMRDSLKPSNEESLLATPTVKPAGKHHSAGKETDSEGSLSSWFKPVSVKQDENRKTFSSVSVENVAKTPRDRPILGMVAAYWNEDETSKTLPKWWDGNGIPNSTTKYKEDQKVSWHATPFEERLEKALSEESCISQRKPITSSTLPVNFCEAEESDTALSRLQSSNHAKPVISF